MSESTAVGGAAAGTAAVLEVVDVVKEYRGGDGSVLRILDAASMTVARGEMVAIIGESGAGKSTLLQLLGGLDRPTAGTVRIAGHDVTRASDEVVAAIRNRSVGFVFQFHHLLRDFSALENVMFPLRIAGRPDRAARERARALLDAVGLGARASHRPGALSGGEQQRVAVARALAAEPALVLADEPSGNLDRGNALRLHELLATLASSHGVGVVVVTHNRGLAARADRVLLLDSGRLVASSAMAEEVG
ncbi:MAG: ABC transporter ATP-binding protein [Gemmatimonadaceae bacterium]|jgi:lipoprotein-releasing system ATP-binding protein|nr:ABC transporter ATP-binding protein [Gemmatimonadaceae bacterium]